jgi:hypothetical protein
LEEEPGTYPPLFDTKGLQAASHEETMKTVKQFVQADTHAKHTYQNLDKTRRTLDMLFDQ